LPPSPEEQPIDTSSSALLLENAAVPLAFHTDAGHWPID
jgi:hypothetical protein